MWSRNLRLLIKSSKLITSTHFFLSMIEQKEIKVIDYTKDQYGDYPFIRSSFRSDRLWTSIVSVDETH